MDAIKNFIELANNLLGLGIPVLLFIYSSNFFFFYILGLNKLYLKLNVVILIISVFIIFMFGNIRSDLGIINAFISTDDGSLGGNIGQSMQIHTRSIFYSTIFLFILSIPVSIFPYKSIKLIYIGMNMTFLMILFVVKSFIQFFTSIISKTKFVSNQASPKTILLNSQTETLVSIDNEEAKSTSILSENLIPVEENKIDSENKQESNPLWINNESKIDDYNEIKSRQNSTSYFDSDSKNEPIQQFSNNTKSYNLPSVDLLDDLKEISISESEINATALKIQDTLGQYDVDVEIGQVQPGPVVTLYGLKPGWITKTKKEKQFDADGNVVTDENGRQIMKEVQSKNRVKVDSIMSREKDLSLALKTPSIRIETPVLGESLVGIEVPNPNPGLIGIKSLIKDSSFANLLSQNDSLPIALGKGSGGDNVTIDLTKMPHLLIAGATGSGKSVCMNAIVSSLIYSRSPDQLRLLLVDPKRVELTQYNGIPHMVTPVIVELDSVAKVFRGVINEMFKRYKLLESQSVRNISELNKKFINAMPYLVIVIDELADLMMTSGVEIERSICRLAQLGRATGIHLVIATQRPSVDVVTGLIKSNFPSRVSFSVSSSIDSRTILDTTGAEKLLGKGDMLYLPIDASLPSRLQGCFINDSEISKLVNFWKNNSFMNSQYEINVFDDLNENNKTTNDNGLDPNKDILFNDAVGLAKSTKKLSISFLQRKLRIGYPRAARLMDELEEEGIVGPMQDSIKSRDVIIN
jgi:DNA segregation ATPase FtsK/SpoIIIE-like protein|tara:strand:- start:7259 stop:9508 length:2250 start_codon:yes stop_codon:yes gene_type:complete